MTADVLCACVRGLPPPSPGSSTASRLVGAIARCSMATASATTPSAMPWNGAIGKAAAVVAAAGTSQ